MREMRGSSVCWDMSSTCVQGGLSRPLVGYQPNVMMEAHSPAPAWHMHSSIVIKKEPMEEERNDSGITSGSDFQSSSPGSDNSQDYNPAYTAPAGMKNPNPYYNNTPVTSHYNQPNLPMPYQTSTPLHLGFNPLTPPSSEPMASPKDNTNLKLDTSEQETTLTPRGSPSITVGLKSPTSGDDGERRQDEQENPLRRLQMSFEKGDYLPVGSLSPKTTSEHSNDDDNKSDPGTDEGDEENLRKPKVNSHGKMKTFKCKQCDFVAVTKLSFWEHSKGHIKTDKLLTCPKCPFVTEYKHHLEYHLRNHFGSKPFKCDKCNYSCVNKSMLNSHMKSHSNIYQYRCHDCSYATKYCHSLKLHLRKYSHKPAMVLNPDGTPNPLPIIDVYGTRRGPKMKIQQSKEENEAMQNPFAQLIMGATSQLPMNFPYPFMGGFPGALGNPLFFPQLAQLARERNLQEQQQDYKEEEKMDDGALDLSKTEPTSEPPTKNRRKGRAFKLDRSTMNQQYHSDEEEVEQQPEKLSNEKTTDTKPISEGKEEEVTNNNHNDFVCQFCCISFGDLVLYTMHMGYHGYKDPFTCNMCGEQCTDKVAFFLHIARNPHT